MDNPFRYFNSSPEVIRLAVMMYIRYPLSVRQVEDLLFERGIDKVSQRSISSIQVPSSAMGQEKAIPCASAAEV